VPASNGASEGVHLKPDRNERFRKRMREALVQRRRALLQEAKEIEKILLAEEADDDNTALVIPGHSADLPRTGNIPPPLG